MYSGPDPGGTKHRVPIITITILGYAGTLDM